MLTGGATLGSVVAAPPGAPAAPSAVVWQPNGEASLAVQLGADGRKQVYSGGKAAMAPPGLDDAQASSLQPPASIGSSAA